MVCDKSGESVAVISKSLHPLNAPSDRAPGPKLNGPQFLISINIKKMLEENLSKLGLSPSEIKVWLSLLSSGRSYANKISFDTKLNRTNFLLNSTNLS